MPKTTSKQLRFPVISGMSVRAAFDDGAMPLDFDDLLLAGVDRQMELTDRLVALFHDRRRPSYVFHALADLLKQHMDQQARPYEDGSDGHPPGADPMFKLAVARKPPDEGKYLASQPACSRLENAAIRSQPCGVPCPVLPSRRDIVRLSRSVLILSGVYWYRIVVRCRSAVGRTR